jgi:hypothetical protein
MKLLMIICTILYVLALGVIIWHQVHIIHDGTKSITTVFNTILRSFFIFFASLTIVGVLIAMSGAFVYHWLILKPIPSYFVWLLVGMFAGLIVTVLGLTSYTARYEGRTFIEQLQKPWTTSDLNVESNFTPDNPKAIAADFASGDQTLERVAYAIITNTDIQSEDLSLLDVNAYNQDGRSLLALALQFGNSNAANQLFEFGANPFASLVYDNHRNFFSVLADPYLRIGMPVQWQNVPVAKTATNPEYQIALETQVVAFLVAFIDAGGDPNSMIPSAKVGELINDTYIEYQEHQPLIMYVSYGGQSLPLRYLVTVGADPWRLADTIPGGRRPAGNLITQLADWSDYEEIEWLIKEGYFDNRSSEEYEYFFKALESSHLKDDVKVLQIRTTLLEYNISI